MSDQRKSLKVLGWVLVPLVVIAAGIAWYVLDPAFRASQTVPDATAALPKDEFERRVRDFILKNPEVIMEAARRFEQRQRAAEEGEAVAALTARADEILRDPDTPVGGNPEGDVTIVEFFDYNCPYCRQVSPVMVQAESDDAKLRVVYKEFPILGPNSMFAAKAALAVHRQGKYVAFHHALMQGKSAVDENRVIEVASKLGIDVTRMKSDMNEAAIGAAIEKNLALAQALRINGTPGFIIGRQILRGATDLKTMKALILEARNVQ